jgi:predicted transcriptional regulator
MLKSMMELVTEIVSGQSSQRVLSGEEIAALIRQTYRALKEIETLESGGESIEESDRPIEVQYSTPDVNQSVEEQAHGEPMIDPSESIQEDKIVCIECGREFKTLTHTHLKEHGITPEEYKKKWGIRETLAAKSVSERRKAQARERNLGEQLKKARAAKRSSETQ